MEIGEWLQNGQKELAKTQEHISALYAITGHVLNKSASWIISHPEKPLTHAEIDHLQSHLNSLLTGIPLAYILGKQEFFGRPFIVNENVLIPRPETELLVENAILAARNFGRPVCIADVGTGSGCIAVTLAKEIPECCITATDISRQTLQVAAANAEKHAVSDKVSFIQNDLLTGVAAKFDILCANLPYIPSATLKDLDVIRTEPLAALDGGADGFIFIRPLLDDLARVLSPDGSAFFEIEAQQGTAFEALCRTLYPQACVKIIDDLAGLPRLGKIQI